MTSMIPGWRARDAVRQPFVLTLCAGGDFAPAQARADRVMVDLGQGAWRALDARSGERHFECLPAEAWSLLQALRRDLDDCDLCLRPLDSPPIRLLICDMDMTIVDAETLDEVAAELGLGERIAAITHRAMHGEIDFNAALRERIGMLAGQPEQVFHDVAAGLGLNPGARELLAAAREAGVYRVLISGGFAQVADAVAQQLDFDAVVCNHLDIADGQLTGEVIEPIVNADLKRQTLEDLAGQRGIALEACCAIGDGANDAPMVAAAGLGISYHGKPVLREVSDCHIDATDLASAIHFMRLAAD